MAKDQIRVAALYDPTIKMDRRGTPEEDCLFLGQYKNDDDDYDLYLFTFEEYDMFVGAMVGTQQDPGDVYGCEEYCVLSEQHPAEIRRIITDQSGALGEAFRRWSGCLEPIAEQMPELGMAFTWKKRVSDTPAEVRIILGYHGLFLGGVTRLADGQVVHDLEHGMNKLLDLDQFLIEQTLRLITIQPERVDLKEAGFTQLEWID
jgi:hypothetical protein